MDKKTLTTTSLAGTSTTRERAENDYYATSYGSIKALLDNVEFTGNFLEPCVGGGHIVEVIKQYYPNEDIFYMDIVDRGYEDTLVDNFLEHDFKGQKFDNIITNPPYSLAQEFLERSMEIINENGKVAMFLKIQFLEGVKRREMFKKYPPKYIYVFTKRQNTWRNGSAVDEKGKPWATTMCFAWFIWEEGFNGEPIVRWL
ncbi:NAD(P)-dependent oxidoreductase [Clostridium sp.]|uniref:NAD(P)-dependent oxidoreductase n=1 Tax=Clostridium sp. TaxID=1506 RepID=UPI0025C096C5|nr:NAD(P)-dependent oxidoreductase [Clostridium sp.]